MPHSLSAGVISGNCVCLRVCGRVSETGATKCCKEYTQDFFKSSLKFLLPVGPSSSSQSECSLAMKDPKTLPHETWLDATLV